MKRHSHLVAPPMRSIKSVSPAEARRRWPAQWAMRLPEMEGFLAQLEASDIPTRISHLLAGGSTDAGHRAALNVVGREAGFRLVDPKKTHEGRFLNGVTGDGSLYARRTLVSLLPIIQEKMGFGDRTLTKTVRETLNYYGWSETAQREHASEIAHLLRENGLNPKPGRRRV